MRKPILLAASLIILCVFQVDAQVQKSDQNLGFGFDVSSLGGDFGESRVNLFATYSYYFTKNLSLGVGPRYGWTKTKSDDGQGGVSTNNVTVLGYNIFFNYNLLTSGGFVLPYFGAQYTSATQKREGSQDLQTSSVGGNVGVKFFLTERFNIDNNISFTRVFGSNQTTDTDANVIQVNVGLGYIIGRRN